LLQSDLRRALGVAGPTVSKMVRSLMELGFLVKVRAPHDRRERIVQLTESGRRVLDEAIRATMARAEADGRVMSALSGSRHDVACGRVAAVNVEEVLLRVRTAFGDRARLVYVFNPYEWGWRPPRSAPLYDDMLSAP
jgi:DNA-binding MarR family transcriptional regulator